MASSMSPALYHGVLARSTTSSAAVPPSWFRLSSSECLCRSRVLTSIISDSQRKDLMRVGQAHATTAILTEIPAYTLPLWTEFEMGLQPVFWETKTGKSPASGESVTIFFNPTATKLVPNLDYGIGFNGGFNQPIMCGGEPRLMTRRERGPSCAPLFTIRINVPQHALTLEFSFTDGKDWDGPYVLKFQVPKKWRNQPITFFNEGLAKELSEVGACDNAIFPDAAFVENRCFFPASLIHEGGNRCDLDLVPGCTDPDNPFYDPLANVDDGSCPFISDESSDEES